jgi:mycothiol synthase
MSDSPRSDEWLYRLIDAAKAADGQPPFSDQSLVDYRTGARDLIQIDEDAAALVAAPGAAEGGREAEFVVTPSARGHGLGTQLLETVLARGATLFWAHGDAPAARALAASHGLKPVRELLHFVGTVRPSTGSVAEGWADHFVVGVDEAEWVALNARTFAHHAEQGSVSMADVEQLETEAWFRSDNFLVLRDDGRMIGYCWLKVEHNRGEFYVVGLDPNEHGQGLGGLLFDAGLQRLADLGIHDAHLYVEADNVAGVHLYRSRGFAQDSIDIQYAVAS